MELESYMGFSVGEFGECEECGDNIDTDKDGYYEAWECPECMSTLCDKCSDIHICMIEDDEEE